MKNFKKLLLSALCVLAAVAVNGCKNSGPKAPSAAASLTEQIGDHSYKVVKINGKIWMAENLRNENVSHYSANGDSGNDAKYGYLYTCENAKQACPSGWRLPSKEEFEQMLLATSNIKEHYDDLISYYSLTLRSTSWNDGNNRSGFGALPAGDRSDGYYNFFGSYVRFWSATPFSDSRAYNLYVNSDIAYVVDAYRDNAFSVRCLRDED